MQMPSFLQQPLELSVSDCFTLTSSMRGLSSVPGDLRVMSSQSE